MTETLIERAMRHHRSATAGAPLAPIHLVDVVLTADERQAEVDRLARIHANNAALIKTVSRSPERREYGTAWQARNT